MKIGIDVALYRFALSYTVCAMAALSDARSWANRREVDIMRLSLIRGFSTVRPGRPGSPGQRLASASSSRRER
jgi:hypothetical protein